MHVNRLCKECKKSRKKKIGAADTLLLSVFVGSTAFFNPACCLFAYSSKEKKNHCCCINVASYSYIYFGIYFFIKIVPVMHDASACLSICK